jgi:hypothetical protein
MGLNSLVLCLKEWKRLVPDHDVEVSSHSHFGKA